MASCPECDAELQIEGDDLEHLEIGEPWTCGECASHLRVANRHPLEFDSDDELDEEIERDQRTTDDSDDDDDDDGDWEE
jgi:hypothetical protein